MTALLGYSVQLAPARHGQRKWLRPRKTSNQGGVKITVEPRGFLRGAKTWDFAATLETHAQPLLADGKPCRSLGWVGEPPGGHHREGVLRFEAVTPQPQVLELQIRRTGRQLGTPL